MPHGKRKRVGRPKEKYSQAQRLLELHHRLIRGDTLRASDLARDLDRDKRTLQRDLKILEAILGDALVPSTAAQRELRLKKTRRAKPRASTTWQVVGLSLGIRIMPFFCLVRRFTAGPSTSWSMMWPRYRGESCSHSIA